MRRRKTHLDGFVKSPIGAKRCIPHHCGVRKVRLILRDLRRLELVLFSLPSKAEFLRDLQTKTVFPDHTCIKPMNLIFFYNYINRDSFVKNRELCYFYHNKRFTAPL